MMGSPSKWRKIDKKNWKTLKKSLKKHEKKKKWYKNISKNMKNFGEAHGSDSSYPQKFVSKASLGG